MSSENTSSPTPHTRDTATITVRFTRSIADTHPLLGSLRDLNATLAFASLTRAYTFEERLNQHDDARTYRLTPDHTGDATLYLRCSEQRRA